MNTLLTPEDTQMDGLSRPAGPEPAIPTPNRYDFIGKSIRAIREELKLSQVAVATLAGLSQAQMSNYEKGINNPSPENIFRICEALGIDPLVFALKCLEQTELIDPRNSLRVAEFEEIAQQTVISIQSKRAHIHRKELTDSN